MLSVLVLSSSFLRRVVVTGHANRFVVLFDHVSLMLLSVSNKPTRSPLGPSPFFFMSVYPNDPETVHGRPVSNIISYGVLLSSSRLFDSAHFALIANPQGLMSPAPNRSARALQRWCDFLSFSYSVLFWRVCRTMFPTGLLRRGPFKHCLFLNWTHCRLGTLRIFRPVCLFWTIFPQSINSRGFHLRLGNIVYPM
jgi:hypothetical protein